MGTSLPALGTISYNGYIFSAFCKSRMRADVVPDRAGRTTKWIQYTLDVEDIVTPFGTSNTDAEMISLRQKLTVNGAALYYQGRGFTDLIVNNSGNPIRDVNYGPKPRMIDMQPLGSNQAWKIHWQVTTCIPECSKAKYTGIADYSYEVSFSIDNGYTTRTITGFLEIAASRLNGGRNPIPDETDFPYWERIFASFALLPNFRRLPYERRMSADKKTMNFTMRDKEEYPNFFVEGMESWEGDHELTSQMLCGGPYQPGGGFTIWGNSLTASFRVQRDKPKSLAWSKFAMLIQDRINSLTQFFPLSLRVHDRLSSQEVSFTFTYLRQGSSIDTFLVDNNVWKKLNMVGWSKWQAEAQKGILAPRGYANLVYQTAYDAVIDLCGGDLAQWSPGGLTDAPQVIAPAAKLDSKLPPANKSHLDYKCAIRFAAKGKISRHKPLGGPTPPIPGGVFDTNIKALQSQGTIPPDVIQQGGAAAGVMVVTGEGVRVGYPATPPRLLTVGNQPAYLQDQNISSAQVGESGGVPIYGGRWELTYMLPQMPAGNVPVPNNPLAPSNSGPVSTFG